MLVLKRRFGGLDQVNLKPLIVTGSEILWTDSDVQCRDKGVEARGDGHINPAVHVVRGFSCTLLSEEHPTRGLYVACVQ